MRTNPILNLRPSGWPYAPIFLCLAVWISSVMPGLATTADPKLRRGISAHGWLTWPSGANDDGTFTWPPFAQIDDQISIPELKQLHALGFDFIRLTLDPAPFIAFSSRRQLMLDKLDTALDAIESASLDVVVDIHPRQSDTYAWSAHRLLYDGALFPQLVSFIGDLSRHMQARASHREALELFNEPDVKCDRAGSADWKTRLDRMFNAAAPSTPAIKIVVPLACLDPRNGQQPLMSDTILKHPSSVFTVHFYNPFYFTHQGVKGEISEPFSGLQYPAPPSADAAITKLVNSRLEKAEPQFAADTKRRLANYLEDNRTSAVIDDFFKDVALWSDRTHLARSQILLGEFGVNRQDNGSNGADPMSRQRWLRFVREAAEADGFGWAIWNYHGRYSEGMDFVTSDTNRNPGPGIVCALGLTPLSEAERCLLNP